MSCGWCGHGHCPWCGHGHGHGHGCCGCGPPPWAEYGPPPWTSPPWAEYGPPPWTAARRASRRRGQRTWEEEDLAAHLHDLEEEAGRIREELERRRARGGQD